MKRMQSARSLLAFTLCACTIPAVAQNPFDRLKQAVKDKATDKTNQQVDNAVDSADNAATKSAQQSDSQSAAPAADANASTPDASSATADSGSASGSDSISAYHNYDFVPGDTILFADDFTSAADGEFPDQWELVKGQGVANLQKGRHAFVLTDGNYMQTSPRIRQASYLGDAFTIEYDTYFLSNAYPLQIFFEAPGDVEGSLAIGKSSVDYDAGSESYTLSGNLPGSISDDNFVGKWRHIAIAVRNKQMKVYVDQYRVFTIPDMHLAPTALRMGGLAGSDAPLIFTNFRIASGGGMNMLGKKFTDAKLVTHGINFDVDKSTLRPESMGTLNEVKNILDSNPDLHFEIDGHTDNSGNPAHNLTLSQQRADAVKSNLVSMGVAPSRLTTKGFGDTKPLSDNSTPEGKANNRRVEFVRVP